MSDPTLVVMAAGMGSRFGGLKQVEPVGPNGETHYIEAGKLVVGTQIYIPGELNHVNLLLNAEYQRLVGTASAGATDITTSVPVR